MNFTFDFRPGVSENFNVPESNFLFNAVPHKAKTAVNEEDMIVASLDNPIGSPRLNELLKPAMRLVILVDDITRPTPTARLLPHIMERIRKIGIPDDRIDIIMAPGTHRPMTEKELEIKLGRGIMERYRVLNREYRESRKFQDLGKTKSGIPVEVDREVFQADFVIGLGNIVPHISAGWGGGAKIILPGVCSARTTDRLHYTACIAQPVLDILGTCDNVPRKEMEEIAGRAGLSFIVNTVLDQDRNMQGVFSGHYVEAHRRGVELAKQLLVVPIPCQADILVVSANPCHFDYWQGIKPYTYAHRAVREGGVLIFMIDGGDHLCGDAPSHEPALRKYMHWSLEDMKQEVEQGKAVDIVGMNVPMYHAMVHQRTTNLIVTNHMTKDEVAVLGFERQPSVQVALERAFGILGKHAGVGLIPFGGETLTRVEPKARQSKIERR